MGDAAIHVIHHVHSISVMLVFWHQEVFKDLSKKRKLWFIAVAGALAACRLRQAQLDSIERKLQCLQQELESTKLELAEALSFSEVS